MRRFRMLAGALPSIVLFVCALACGAGETTGEQTPGGTTPLDPDPNQEHSIGGIAVQPDLRNGWVVHRDVLEGEGAVLSLAAVETQTLAATDVFDVTGITGLQMLFPHTGRGLLFGRQSGDQFVIQVDTDSLATGLSTTLPGNFVDARSAPSGRFVAVQDGEFGPGMEIHLFDVETLTHSTVPAPGYLQATWNHASDHLIGIAETTGPADEPIAHLMRWTIGSATSIPAPDFETVLPGYVNDCYFSYNWVGISPDDRWAIFPLTKKPEGQRWLAVLDQQDGSVRMVPGSGPVGFTPDSSTIVAYAGQSLVLVDAVSLAITTVETPNAGQLQYFTSHAGNQVVVAANAPGDHLLIYDQTNGTMTDLQVEVALDEFVWRVNKNELWSASRGELWKITLDTPTAEKITNGYPVGHLNIVPPDKLLIAPATGGILHAFDMATETDVGTVSLELE